MRETDRPPQLAATWPVDWGRLLRTARQVAGFSLTELSLATGLSKGHLSKLESGHPTAANPSRATLAALARALPSFRPLANTLEPSAAIASLVFDSADDEAQPRADADVDADSEPRQSPIHLGWRELEVVMALLALESSASPIPLTALLLARAVGRRVRDIQPILDNLVKMGVLVTRAPAVYRAPVTYNRAAEFEQRTGIVRIGDALVLAAGLLAQAPAKRRERTTHHEGEMREA